MAIGVALAIVLLLFWLTLAIWIDDEPDELPAKSPPKSSTTSFFVLP